MIDKKELVKLISFFSAFDGGLYKSSKNSNARFIINMREENKDYLLWIKDVIENITSVSLKERKDYNTDGYNRQPQLRLESKSHPFFTTLQNRMYILGKKVLDLHMLKLLDAEALAIIFMADGSTCLETRFKNPHCNITLNTKGYSEADNLALSKAIYEKLNIRTTVNRQNSYFYLRVKTKDVRLFINTIFPYLKPSFFYKIERIAPALDKMLDDDIVWTKWKHLENDGNNHSQLEIVE